MRNPLTRAQTRRVAELQMAIKRIDAEIHASSSVQETFELRSRRAEAQAELHSIISSTSAWDPSPVSSSGEATPHE